MSFAFAAAVQPGPLQAFLLTQVLKKGWKKTLPASFSPLISDIPIAILVLLLLKNISPGLSKVLQGGGGVLLLYLAWSGIRQLMVKGTGGKEEKGGVPGTFFKAVTVNLLNPNPYLGWSLIMGPMFLRAWGEAPFYGAALIVSFYATMASVLALTIIFFGTTSYINEKNKLKLQIISYLVLVLLGIYQLAMAFLKT